MLGNVPAVSAQADHVCRREASGMDPGEETSVCSRRGPKCDLGMIPGVKRVRSRSRTRCARLAGRKTRTEGAAAMGRWDGDDGNDACEDPGQQATT